MTEEISDRLVCGTLHWPAGAVRGSLVLAHGAGRNRHAPVLAAFAAAFCEAGFVVLRYDLPFRQKRATGPPPFGSAEEDQAGLRQAGSFLRKLAAVKGPCVLGGHSYGGRQASLCAAEDASIADALLLLAYPLHPPRRPEQLRTAHWPSLHTPSFFVHGSRDPFGSPEEMRAALPLIAGRTEMLIAEGAGHEMDKQREAVAAEAARRFGEFVI